MNAARSRPSTVCAARALLRILACLLPLGLSPTTAAAQAAIAEPNTSEALLADTGLLQRLAQGGMKRFRFAEAPRPSADVHLRTLAGEPRSLRELRGKLVLVAFWASWCAPCRTELPSLERLASRFGGAAFEIAAVSIDKTPELAARALAGWGVTRLPAYHDEQARAAAALGVVGVPMTLLLDPEGREIGRLRGSAVWDSVEGILLVEAVLGRLTKIKSPPRD